MALHRRWREIGFGSLVCVAWLIAPSPAQESSAASPEPKSLRFRVVDGATGRPVEGVAIDTQADRARLKTQTDGQGRCSLEVPDPAPSMFTVWAKKDGFVPVYVQWGDRAGGNASIPDEHTLALEKGTTIGGLIRDDKGNAVGGATVFVLVPSDEAGEPGKPRVNIWDFEAKTDAEGRWHCDVVPAKLDDVWLRLAHPDFVSDTMYGVTPKPTLERLRDRTGVMVLKKGITVEGRVLSLDGDPIAGVTVAQGANRFGSHYPDSTTDKEGRFRFANCAAGDMVLTVQAKGFSPDLRKIAVAPGLSDLEFVLKPGHRIAGRVVDPQGRPVAGAFVAADTWRGYRSLKFRVDTDQDGKFAWDDAPDDNVLFDIGKQDYMSLRRMAIKAPSEDLTITMSRLVKVTGAVIDADTEKPVESFSVLKGIDWGNGQAPFWDRQSARMQKGGQFEAQFDEPYNGHLVRIEAEGYLPASSRLFKDDEGDVTFDFALKKGEGLAGVVIGVDGRPVADAAVCLVTPGGGAYLRNGRAPDRRNSPVVETGPDGRYRFPAQDGKFTLVVLHDGGFALRTEAQLAASKEIKLEAWGRVEGTVRIGDRPAAGESVRLTVQQEGQGDQPRPYFDYRTTADANGHYIIDRVPPGKAFVSREIKLTPRSTGYSHTMPIEVAAGRAARADVGGTGRPVVGRVIAAVRSKLDWSVGSSGLRAALPRIPMPEGLGLDERRKWQEEWSKTPEGKAYQERSQRSYTVKIEGDGSFRIEDIPAGEYELNIAVNEPPVGDKFAFGGELLGSLTQKVVVPEMPGGRSNEPLELGTLELTLVKRVKVGDPAPGFEVATLDGKLLKLEEFRGKFVLLDFWATWCGPCVAETPNLKAAFEAFRNDARFRMIGLSLDPNQDDPRKYVEKNTLGWHQGFLGDFASAKLPAEYGVRGIPSTWLIGPDGKVLAKDLRGPTIKEAIAKALGETK